MFDMIDSKDNLRAIYGFIFSFVIDETMVSPVAVMNVAHNHSTRLDGMGR